MRKRVIIPWLVGMLLVSSGCSAKDLRYSLGGTAPAQKSSPAQLSLGHIEDSCGLLNTRDLAGIFPTHTETILPKPGIASVDHPAFSVQHAPGRETSCDYYSFYLPGSHSEIVLQVHYQLGVPASASAAQVWQQAWAAALAAGTAEPGIADGAFYRDGLLSFEKDNFYLTIEATETDRDLSTASDRGKQLTVERKLGQDIVARLP
jgi:hypothetical protein